MTKIAWPGVSTGGGDLPNEEQQQIRKLIDQFGDILDSKCIAAKINKFTFPVFRQFHIMCTLTQNDLFIFFSPSTGMATQLWHDYRQKPQIPTLNDLQIAINQQLGWSQLAWLHFPSSILFSTHIQQKEILSGSADQWIKSLQYEIEKQQRLVRMNPIFHGRDFLIDDDLCFILMPFDEPFDTIYKNYIKPTVEQKFRIIRADTIFKSSEIIEDIWEHINKAKFIIADVTGKNPNVFYELGIAHTVGKEVFIITQTKDDVPFDVQHRRYFEYSDDKDGLKKLQNDLENAINDLH